MLNDIKKEKKGRKRPYLINFGIVNINLYSTNILPIPICKHHGSTTLLRVPANQHNDKRGDFLANMISDIDFQILFLSFSFLCQNFLKYTFLFWLQLKELMKSHFPKNRLTLKSLSYWDPLTLWYKEQHFEIKIDSQNDN